MLLTDAQLSRWWALDDDVLERLPEISRHNEPQTEPQEYECGCVAITRVTGRDVRHDEKPFEMRLARSCATFCQLARRMRLRELLDVKRRRWCYWVFPNSWTIGNANRYTISIVVEGEAGHYLTGDATAHELISWSDDYEEACAEACEINRGRGIGDNETIRIVASMMGATSGRGEAIL